MGTINDPTTVFADAVLAVTDLTDVSPTDAPVEGDVLVWRIDHWEFEQQSGSGGGTGLPPGGTDGQVLTKQSSADGDANWETFSGGGGSAVVKPTEYVTLRAGAVQSMPQASETAITYSAAQSDDPFGMWDGASLVTVKSAGLYDVTYSYGYAATTGAGNRITLIRINGSTFRQWYHSFTTSVAVMGTLTFEVKLNAGDTIQARQYQSSGAALDTTGTPIAYAPSLFVSKQDVVIEPGGGGVIVERPISGIMRRTTALNADATGSPITWDTTEKAPDGVTFDGVNYVIQTAGLYQVNASLRFTPSAVTATGYIQLRLGKNGGLYDFTQLPMTVNAIAVTVRISRLLDLAVGDTINIAAYAPAGTVAALTSSFNANTFEISKVPQAFAGSAVSTYGEQVYAASRRHDSGVSIPSSTGTPVIVPWNVEDFTDGITYDAGTMEYVIPVAGHYQVNVKVSFNQANATGWRSIRVGVNGASAMYGITYAASQSAAGITSVSASRILKLAAGDRLSALAMQNSGVAIPLQNTAGYNTFDISKVPAPVINGAAASGVWGVGELNPSTLYANGTTDLMGREIYIDSKGQLRGKPDVIYMAKPPTDPITSYPSGTTVMGVGSSDAAAMGWPPLTSCTVVTHKRSDTATGGQWCYLNSSNSTRCWYRNGNSTNWSPWVEVVGDSAPFATAAGTVNMPAVPANGGSAIAITFPVGRFTVAPVVTTNPISNGYGAASSSVSTAAGVGSIKYYNPTATVPSSPQVSWVAVQMTPSSGAGLMALSAGDESTLTCHTVGCENAEAAILLDVSEADAVACGVCGEPITDIVDPT